MKTEKRFMPYSTIQMHHVNKLKNSPLAIATDEANEQHYERTSNAWLDLMDQNKAELYPIVQETYGNHQSVKWWVYWRCFYMACAELWGFRNGEEWFVSHYRFTNKKS